MDLVGEGTPYDYDVVITGNGDGEELGFIDDLCSTLAGTGLRVSKITHKVSRLLETRQKSRISIFVFSKEFASAVWLLRELVTILKSSSASDCLVVPVFYDVDPSEIREQTGSSAAVFAEYKKPYMFEQAQVETWRIALRKASDLTGFLFPAKTDIQESTRIQQIVDFIADGLKKDNASLWFDRECYLMNSGLSMLPENMTFPALTKLLLQDNYDLSEIPLSFFEFMPTLMVLDMSRTSIKDLPPSISRLVRLKRLLLRDCKLLMELPPEIQALKNLEVFDLEGTELIYIPKEIGMLSQLERLIVSLCDCADEYVSEIKENGEIIPRNTLTKLSNLKELSIFVDPACKWWYVEVKAIIQDLFSLKELETIKLYFPTVEVLNYFLQLPKVRNHTLKNFRLIVGRHDQGIISRVPRDLQDSFETLDRCLKYVNGKGNMNIVGTALKYSSAFFLDRHWTIDQLSRFSLNEIQKLRFCMLVECNEMITVIEGDNGAKPVLQLLEYLCICYMKNLESILVGPLAVGSFYKLQVLDLHTCPKLSTVFNIGLLVNLVNLKELRVEDCPKVESIVSIQSSRLESGEKFLPNLEKISLLHLPGLVNIFSCLGVAPRLARMVIFNCPKLQSNSLVEIATTNIKEIKGESVWWKALEWKSNQPPDYLSSVFVPFSGDGLINQLAEARNTRKSLSAIHISNENQKIPTKKKGKAQDKHTIQTYSTTDDLSKAVDKKLEAPRLNKDTGDSKSIRPKRPNKLKLKREKLLLPPDGRLNPNTMSWQMGEFLGIGYFGTVYEGFTDDGLFFAVKEVPFRDQGIHVRIDQLKQRRDQLKREISVLSQLQHENIVQYLGTQMDDSKLYIFLELVPKGSLASLYKKFDLGDSQVSAYTRQILSGLSYLHSRNVAHKDIRCANILVDVNGTVKLADFGLLEASKLIWNHSNISFKSLYWIAPEVFKNNSDDYGLAADIWSLGCTVLEMLTRQVPYFPSDVRQVLDRIDSGELPDIPDSLSEDARDFILKCLQVNPDNRPSAVQLSNHAFVKRPESAVTFPTHSASSS